MLKREVSVEIVKRSAILYDSFEQQQLPYIGGDDCESESRRSSKEEEIDFEEESKPSESGGKIWSDDVETAFVEALSSLPITTGRQKMKTNDGKLYGRNELIARYIFDKTGKVRTRKQVSSHIQVMLKKNKRCDTPFSSSTQSLSMDPSLHIQGGVSMKKHHAGVRRPVEGKRKRPRMTTGKTSLELVQQEQFKNAPRFISQSSSSSLSSSSSSAYQLRKGSPQNSSTALVRGSMGELKAQGSGMFENVHLVQQNEQEELSKGMDSSKIRPPKMHLPFHPHFMWQAKGQCAIRLAHASLPFHPYHNPDQKKDEKEITWKETNDNTLVCHLCTLFQLPAAGKVDIITTLFSFGRPILKYGQRSKSVLDKHTQFHLVLVNNEVLNNFLETFCRDLSKRSEEKCRQSIIQNLVIHQVVVDSGNTPSPTMYGPQQEPTSYLNLTLNLHPLTERPNAALFQ